MCGAEQVMRQVRGEGCAEEDEDDGREGGCEEEGEEAGEEGGLGIFFKFSHFACF